MSDSVQIILILCITYVVGMVINKWKGGIKRPDNTQRKDGAKR